jgi:hypothetical protein
MLPASTKALHYLVKRGQPAYLGVQADPQCQSSSLHSISLAAAAAQGHLVFVARERDKQQCVVA